MKTIFLTSKTCARVIFPRWSSEEKEAGVSPALPKATDNPEKLSKVSLTQAERKPTASLGKFPLLFMD